MISIGELSRQSGVKVETIRYYEQEGVIPAPGRTAGNYRSYDDSHLKRLRFIRRSRELGFTLSEIRQLLSWTDDPAQDCTVVAEMAQSHLTSIQRKIKDLEALQGQLTELVHQCGCGTIAECRIIEALNPD